MAEAASRHGPARVVISGASGLIGKRVSAALAASGTTVVPLVRSRQTQASAGIPWDPERGVIAREALEDCAAVVHLAGENVAQRWTDAARQRIRTSRVAATTLLATTLAGLVRRPRVLVCASAVGWYGDTGERLVTENDANAADFLATVCRDWEAAAEAARKAGIRVVHLRFGMILAKEGGALAEMLPAFRWGAGGPVGSGRQWVSWIAAADAVTVIRCALDDDRWSGAINTVAPEPIRQGDFAATLGAVLHRPAIAPLPGFAVGLLFGDMGRTLLLGSSRIAPGKLRELGFAWKFPDLSGALAHAVA
ncbi:hypothetical protein LBMAG53_39390 [Planctomycetota bacterium]|nr:hypothetical protein LBMAG53_39390 [Planctomycetota bacterium]